MLCHAWLSNTSLGIYIYAYNILCIYIYTQRKFTYLYTFRMTTTETLAQIRNNIEDVHESDPTVPKALPNALH